MSDARLSKLSQTWLKKLLQSAVKSPVLRCKLPKQRVLPTVRFVSNREMRKLCRKYLKKNQATDILSFSAPNFFRKKGHLGELVICSSVLKTQAKRYQLSLSRELQILLTHGFLHLLGFDHEKSGSGARQMARWEKKLLGPRFSQGLITRATSVRS